MKAFILFLSLFVSFVCEAYASDYINVYEGKVLVTSSAYELNIIDNDTIEVVAKNGVFVVENNSELKIFTNNGKKVYMKAIDNSWYYKVGNSNKWLAMPY